MFLRGCCCGSGSVSDTFVWPSSRWPLCGTGHLELDCRRYQACCARCHVRLGAAIYSLALVALLSANFYRAQFGSATGVHYLCVSWLTSLIYIVSILTFGWAVLATIGLAYSIARSDYVWLIPLLLLQVLLLLLNLAVAVPLLLVALGMPLPLARAQFRCELIEAGVFGGGLSDLDLLFAWEKTLTWVVAVLACTLLLFQCYGLNLLARLGCFLNDAYFRSEFDNDAAAQARLSLGYGLGSASTFYSQTDARLLGVGREPLPEDLEPFAIFSPRALGSPQTACPPMVPYPQVYFHDAEPERSASQTRETIEERLRGLEPTFLPPPIAPSPVPSGDFDWNTHGYND